MGLEGYTRPGPPNTVELMETLITAALWTFYGALFLLALGLFLAIVFIVYSVNELTSYNKE
jgi:hypothetical protein